MLVNSAGTLERCAPVVFSDQFHSFVWSFLSYARREVLAAWEFTMYNTRADGLPMSPAAASSTVFAAVSRSSQAQTRNTSCQSRGITHLRGQIQLTCIWRSEDPRSEKLHRLAGHCGQAAAQLGVDHAWVQRRDANLIASTQSTINHTNYIREATIIMAERFSRSISMHNDIVAIRTAVLSYK